jgi:hypothetical protein
MSRIIEVALTYRPHGYGDEFMSNPIVIGKTDDSRVLRFVRDTILEESRREAERWRDIDPGVFAMFATKRARLVQLFNVLLPDEDLAIRGRQEGND